MSLVGEEAVFEDLTVNQLCSRIRLSNDYDRKLILGVLGSRSTTLSESDVLEIVQTIMQVLLNDRSSLLLLFESLFSSIVATHHSSHPPAIKILEKQSSILLSTLYGSKIAPAATVLRFSILLLPHVDSVQSLLAPIGSSCVILGINADLRNSSRSLRILDSASALFSKTCSLSIATDLLSSVTSLLKGTPNQLRIGLGVSGLVALVSADMSLSPESQDLLSSVIAEHLVFASKTPLPVQSLFDPFLSRAEIDCSWLTRYILTPQFSRMTLRSPEVLSVSIPRLLRYSVIDLSSVLSLDSPLIQFGLSLITKDSSKPFSNKLVSITYMSLVLSRISDRTVFLP
ncbi:hypothetical protein GEMRC1_003538 [Eukaryota sp. GEM-RC1]